MSWFAVPALVALFIKLYLIVAKRKLAVKNSAWYYFIFVFAINNFAELLVLSTPDSIESGWVIRSYHPTAIAVLVYCLLYSIGSKGQWFEKTLVTLSAVSGVVLSLFILFTDHLIVGAQQVSYYVTAIKGEYYSLFQAYVLLVCFAISLVLIKNFRKSDDQQTRSEAIWMMLALASPVLITSVCVTMMIFEFNMNALVFTPVGSTLFLLVTLVSFKDDTHQTDPKKYIPYTLENRVSKHISLAEDAFLRGDFTLPEFLNEVEKVALTYASKKKSGNASHIAKMLGIPRTTLYQKGQRLGIEWKSDRQS